MRHSDGTVHFSDLKMMSLSPAHYAHAVSNPKPPTRAMLKGTLSDMLLLTDKEPIVEGNDRRSKEWKAARAAHPPHVEVFTDQEYDDAIDLVKSVRCDALACEYLGIDDDSRVTQLPLRWETNGVLRSTRGIDVLHRGRLVDMKVTATTQPARLQWQVRKMFWYVQLADYREACRQNGIDIQNGAFLVCIESAPPYPVTVLRIGDDALDAGEKLIATWIEQFKACEASGEWPGYVQTPVDFEVASSDEDLEIVLPGDEEAAE